MCIKTYKHKLGTVQEQEKIWNLIKSILFKLLKQIHVGKRVKFDSLLPNKTY